MAHAPRKVMIMAIWPKVRHTVITDDHLAKRKESSAIMKDAQSTSP